MSDAGRSESASRARELLDGGGPAGPYGAIQALRGVSLAVGKGEVVALIGANGAGKTSTLRAVSGMLKPARREDPLRRAGHHRA